MADSDDQSHDHEDSVGHDHEDEAVHAHGHDFGPVSVAVVTISTSRSLEDDPAGDAIATELEGAGNEVATRELVDDDYDGVQGRVNTLVDRDDVDCIVTTGGTGVTPDDVTVEAVSPLFDKVLPGFGELFRAMSREEVGTRVVATRATGGVVGGVPVFCLPGSENAATLGAEIVVEEAPHLAELAVRDTDTDTENGEGQNSENQNGENQNGEDETADDGSGDS